MDRPAPRVLIYGDANMNTIDGSAIWVQSTVQLFAHAGCAVTMLLRTPVETRRHLEALEGLPSVTIVRPFEDGLVDKRAGDRLDAARASALLRRLDDGSRFDAVVLRGFELISRVVDDGGFEGRLWIYLTDLPQDVTRLDATTTDRLEAAAAVARFVLCQTEELRAYLETVVPAACGRAVLFPPVVPEPAFPVPPERAAAGAPLKLVYSGKFAPAWNTLPMTELPRRLAEQGVPARLHALGDKVDYDPQDPGYRRRMLEALRHTPDVVWHGGQTRQAAMRLAADADVGLGWRAASLDTSLELSTKVLEYGIVGLPVVLNRTPMHEALLGVDYPFFARSIDDVVDRLTLAATDAPLYAEAARRCRAAAQPFVFGAAVERTRTLLDMALPEAPAALAARAAPLRVLVAGHDLKFFDRILEDLGAVPGIELRVDRWPDLAVHDPAVSGELVAWADVVICEWFGPNAVWFSAHKRPGQRLIVHLHRFELYRPWPGQARIEAIDQVVCVSQHFARVALQRTGWPGTKVGVIPNYVDDRQLDRPKLEGARFHLGMIGIAPALKRMDLGLDILAALRRDDPRYQLFVKTKMPWDYPGIWARLEERRAFEAVLRRVQMDPAVRHAVTFDAFGPNVPAWLRRIGWVLSTSDGESFHLAPADGAASGAVPVIRAWPGADTIYDPRWVHADAPAMAQAIASLAARDAWDVERRRAQAEMRAAYGLDGVARAWRAVLTDDLPGTVAAPVVDPFA
ncbi:MAG TPA: hypothetical protein VMH24_04170 [Candidatus Sulfotelmatobacter sp.]|nr:hypothetical protein [Candidatus Sulfotelmatobacter sp.]